MFDGGRVRVGISAGAETSVERYVSAVADAGAEPLVLRPGDGLPDAVDALLLPGGGDVEPWRFGAALIDELAAMVKVEPERDRWEWRLLDLAFARELPVLGVCRGFQVLNAYEGGTLYQHLPAAGFDSVDHHPGGRRDLVAHELVFEEGRLSLLMGEERGVNSIHHRRRARGADAGGDGQERGRTGRGPGESGRPAARRPVASRIDDRRVARGRAMFLDLVERRRRPRLIRP